ncbi:hypothetical protein CDCA_CDCA09G2683 [Cyanidium caldarium]|uniref:Uncharacterized protein n=1 Tax=Cyanidium caldarium TaxID=2771 RepID=A0AAV9IXX9_CYACA|nr:hypothetical protein CDCA_CDCA09G2683 [Cyanidium caldarium]|eukprot:ctg_2817.g557
MYAFPKRKVNDNAVGKPSAECAAAVRAAPPPMKKNTEVRADPAPATTIAATTTPTPTTEPAAATAAKESLLTSKDKSTVTATPSHTAAPTETTSAAPSPSSPTPQPSAEPSAPSRKRLLTITEKAYQLWQDGNGNDELKNWNDALHALACQRAHEIWLATGREDSEVNFQQAKEEVLANGGLYV